MTIFSKDSLEELRTKIDLVEVLSGFISLNKSGAFYKAHCPFHDEKTPSFTVQRNDHHYHCYGCGAHGDAISFLMQHQKMSFSQAVEYLAEKFQVHLEKAQVSANAPSINKTYLKQVMENAKKFYHFTLLHTPEGQIGLNYLFQRGIDLAFIKRFHLGLAPQRKDLFIQTMQDLGISKKDLLLCGLIKKDERDFFFDRIMIPIHDAFGAVIGFSARKYKEETFGGKYVNSPESVLFKKSRVLFGLNYSKKRIMKERRVLIVEGQLDALSLIQNGFDWVVASQGTAFTEEHVKLISDLEVNVVYLALDSDLAGQEAAIKTGHLFQKHAIEVLVVSLPEKSDPDEVLKEKGPEAFEKLLKSAQDYLSFLVGVMSRKIDINSPAGKNELVEKIAKQIKTWEHPLMVHESLRKLARLTQTPETVVGVGQAQSPNVYIKKSASLSQSYVDPDRVLETDLLRWLFLVGVENEQIVLLAKSNLHEEHFHVNTCKKLFQEYMKAYENKQPRDLLAFAIHLDDAEQQLFISEMLQKKVNKEKAYDQFILTVQKILDRHWMRERETIKMRIQSGKCTEDEALELAKRFDEIRKNRPQIEESFR